MAGATLFAATPESAADTVLCAVALLMIVLCVGYCALRVVYAEEAGANGKVTTTDSNNGFVVHSPLAVARVRAASQELVPLANSAAFRWLFVGHTAWFVDSQAAAGDDDEQDRRARSEWVLCGLGSVVTRYRGPLRGPATSVISDAVAALTPWFFVFEVLLTIGMGVAQALTQTTCLGALWLSFMINTAGFLASLLLRPYTVPAKNIVLVCSNALMCSGSALALAASAKDGHTASSPDRTLTTFAAECFAAAAMLSFVSIALTLVRLLLAKIVWRAEIVPAIVTKRRSAAGGVSRETKARESGGGGVYDDPLLQDPSAARELLISPPTVTWRSMSSAQRRFRHCRQPTTSLALLGTNGTPSSKSSAAPPAAEETDHVSGWAYGPAAALRIQRTQEGQRLFDELHTLLNDGSLPAATSTYEPAATAGDFDML